MRSFISLPPTPSPLEFTSIVGVSPAGRKHNQDQQRESPSRESVSDTATVRSRMTLIRAHTGQTDTASRAVSFLQPALIQETQPTGPPFRSSRVASVTSHLPHPFRCHSRRPRTCGGHGDGWGRRSGLRMGTSCADQGH